MYLVPRGFTVATLLLKSLYIICILGAMHGRAFADDPRNIQLPLQFVENTGQWDVDVRFGIIRGMDKAAFTREGIVLFRPQQRPVMKLESEFGAAAPDTRNRLLESSTLRFVDPSPHMRIEGMERTSIQTQFYIGGDKARWRERVPTFRGIRYVNVWDGIDIEYVEHHGKLVQRIVAAAEADLGRINFETGNLTEIDLHAPVESRDRSESAGELQLNGNTARVIPYRNYFEKRKVIETEFNSYFGGSGTEWPRGIDIDDEGNILIALFTTSMDMPVKNAFQPSHHRGHNYQTDYYLARFNPRLVMSYGTFLGGSEDDWAPGYNMQLESDRMLAAGPDGAAHFLCNTHSTDFPVAGNVLQTDVPPPTPNTGTYCSMVRLDSTGRLDAATWIGKPSPFLGISIDMDGNGQLFVVGACRGEQWFVTQGTIQDTFIRVTGNDSSFSSLVVARIGPRYDTVHAATYLLSDPDFSSLVRIALTVGSDGNPVIAAKGIDTLNRPPEVRSWRRPISLVSDLLLMKLQRDLTDYVFTTWLGSKVELADVRTDAENNIIIAGDTYNPQIPLLRPITTGPADAFVVKFPPTGGEPVFSTRLPWSTRQEGGVLDAIVPLSCGDIAIVGTSSGADLTFLNPPDTVLGVNGSPFMIVLSADGQQLRSSGYWQVDEKYPTQRFQHFGVGNMFYSGLGLISYLTERNGMEM